MQRVPQPLFLQCEANAHGDDNKRKRKRKRKNDYVDDMAPAGCLPVAGLGCKKSNKKRLYVALYPSGVVGNEERRYVFLFSNTSGSFS